MSNGNKLSLLSEAAAFVEHTDDSPPSRLKEALLKTSNSTDASTHNSAGTLGQLGAHPPIRKEMSNANVNHDADSSPYTSRSRPVCAPYAADGMDGDSDNAAAYRQNVETQTFLTTHGAAQTQRWPREAAETKPIDSTAFVSISSSLAPQLAAPNSFSDALLQAATANYLSTYFAHLAQAQAQAHAAMQGVSSDNVILSSLPLIATPYSLAIGSQSPASSQAAQLNGGVTLQRPAVLPIIGVQLPPRNSLPGDACSCRSRADDSRMAELKLRLVEFDAESGISARTLDSERGESTRLRSSSEVVTESLSSRCIQPAAVALQQRSAETESASGPARPEDDESPTSQSQLCRPYKKRKVVIRAFSDVTAERRARAQTPTQFGAVVQQPDAVATSSMPDAPENGSHSRFMGDDSTGTRSPLPGCYYAYGPSRRRLLVAAAASTPRSSCMSPLDHHNAAVRNRSQSPYSLSSALSGASSPCSSLSGSCTNLLDAVACSHSNGLSASFSSSIQQTIASSLQSSATAAGSDTFNALKAFRGLSIGSRVSTTSTTPVSIGAPSSSGYASELPSSSGCFASPTHAVSASAAKANRSVVIMNVDADEQLEEHFARSLLRSTNETQLQLQKSNNSLLDMTSKQRLPIVGKPDRLVDEHIRKSLVQRAASSVSRSQKVTVKRTESCPQTLKRTAPASPPQIRAPHANIYYVNESGADTITSDDRRHQLSVDVAVDAQAQMWPHRVDHAQVTAQKLVNTVGDAGVVIKVERDESVDVDEHFRRALGNGWTNITKLHTGLPSTASATEESDAIEVTHL